MFQKPHPSPARAAFSLVEVMITITVIMIGIGGIVSALVASQNLGRVNREMATATEAAQSILERLKAASFEEVYALYNDDPLDDPGPGPAPGSSFAVSELTPRADDVDGMVGRVIFPEVDGSIREDVVDPILGMPRDLNFDGVIDSADHSDNYLILPVRVVLEWRGVAGNTRVELPLTLALDWATE